MLQLTWVWKNKHLPISDILPRDGGIVINEVKDKAAALKPSASEREGGPWQLLHAKHPDIKPAEQQHSQQRAQIPRPSQSKNKRDIPHETMINGDMHGKCA